MSECPLGTVIPGAVMTDCDGIGVPVMKNGGVIVAPPRPYVLGLSIFYGNGS